MSVDTSVIGRQTGAWRVALDRSVLANFAAAVGDTSAAYRRADAARAADLHVRGAVLVGALDRRAARRSDRRAAATPCTRSWASCTRKGALVLHGEQEFEYHRTPVAGDVLDGVQTITDIYEKASETADMTFVVMETQWTDARDGSPVVTERFNLIARLRK